MIPTPPGATRGEAVGDPFAWTPKRSDELSKRAAAGTAHLLYTRSPDGAAATAERVARFRPRIERAAKAAGVDPDRLEALVFLESAGRPDARAPGGIEGAAGLTQILAETATSLLGMQRRRRRAAAATRAGWSARCATGNLPRAAALNRARRRVDDRFDPAKALAGTARYLKLAERALRPRGPRVRLLPHGHGQPGERARGASAAAGGPTPSSTSTRRRCATRPPSPSSPRSATTPRTTSGSSARRWRSCGSRATTRPRLARIAALQTADDSARALLLDGAPQGDLRDADRRPPPTPSLSAAPDVKLRPEALGAALYAAAQVRDDLRRAGAEGDRRRRRRLDVPRLAHLRLRRQALAFQYVLDRLQVLNVIAWSRSARSINVTAVT